MAIAVARHEAMRNRREFFKCAGSLLPLGLPPATKWISQNLWAGEDFPADRAISDVKSVAVPALSRGE